MPRLALLAALLPLLLCAPASAQYDAAYVINEGSGSVSVVDTNTDTVSTTIKVGERPRGLALSSGAERIYVSHEDGTLIERDMYAREESGGTKLGRLPRSIDLSPDGRSLAAAIQGDAVSGGGIVLLDLAAMRIVKTIPLEDGKRPAKAVYSPNGRWIFASAEDSRSLYVIDVKQHAVTKSIPVGHRLRGIAFTPDGSRAYVAAEQDSEVVVIDVARQAVLSRMKTGSSPFGVIPHPDGKRVFVSAAGAGKVQVLDTGTHKIVAEAEGCRGPSSMALASGGNKLYMSCAPANEVSVIDTSTYKRVAQVPVGDKPGTIVIDFPPFFPDGGERPPRPGKIRGS